MLNLNDDTDDLVLLENALVVPPGPETKSKWQPSGVLDGSGALVENSISWSTSQSKVNNPPEMPAPKTVKDISGTYMFAGISYGHFGHFITESLSRVWALDELRDKIDGLIFTPKFQMRDNLRPFEVYREILDAMGVDLPIICPDGPVRVSKLYVPKQGFGLGDLIGGSEKFRSYIQKYAGSSIPSKGAEKIYISRSRLPSGRGGLLGESKLEEYLTAEGYEIFHPQYETKQDQLSQYKAARNIIAVDCSPLHLVGYVGNSDQRVGILTRRSMDFGKMFTQQLSLFRGIDCHVIDALVNDWLPANSNRPSRSSFGEVRFSEMYRQLKAAGLIEGTTPWEDLTQEERDADLARIAEAHKLAFKPFKPDESYA
ncbi:glycosyltransferase family 61 protein [Paracoccus siganidrum]|uniref:Glycosyltransferase family 61 protein n=1 Tax=Paracoccus siganidrum TaxID=1276757 RepID=A0A419A6U9_9RHOB|nr:glycosyltransferase 61 family protein [Paracoccus siganidrum]RJL14206.1 glycosyltransferase family 61 protein [Paracoccus siganidrum]RMC33462.1 glycosyltransferase family 61 protein [Paracoccus siganidrum]